MTVSRHESAAAKNEPPHGRSNLAGSFAFCTDFEVWRFAFCPFASLPAQAYVCHIDVGIRGRGSCVWFGIRAIEMRKATADRREGGDFADAGVIG